jgi:hypothetical protein
LSALGDIVSQLTKMADDSVMSAADESVKQLGSQLNELLERMNGRKTLLQVSKNACFIATIPCDFVLHEIRRSNCQNLYVSLEVLQFVTFAVFRRRLSSWGICM